MAAQVLPLVTFCVAALMLLNLVIVQPLKEFQAAAQAQTQAQVQALLRDVQDMQAESRHQFKLLHAAAQEVHCLSGKVEVVQNDLRSLQLR